MNFKGNCGAAGVRETTPWPKKRDRESTEAGLAKELANLPTLDRDQLKCRWRRLYGTEPPPRASQILLRYAVAYALQEAFWGGLKPSVVKLLEASLEGKTAPVAVAPVGTKLLREWNGTIHEVEVLDSGVLYRGALYRSLSEVAKLISGHHRSGPLFFGLKERSPAKVVHPAQLAAAQGDALKALVRTLPP